MNRLNHMTKKAIDDRCTYRTLADIYYGAWRQTDARLAKMYHASIRNENMMRAIVDCIRKPYKRVRA